MIIIQNILQFTVLYKIYGKGYDFKKNKLLQFVTNKCCFARVKCGMVVVFIGGGS